MEFVHGLWPRRACILNETPNDRALGNNRTAVYAPATFYWTGRSRQRTILDSKVHRRRAYQPAEQHSPKRRRDIAIGGEDDGGSGLELGFEAPGISILEVCGKLIQRYIVKSSSRATEKRRERMDMEREEMFRRGAKRISQIYFRVRFISVMLVYPPDRRK